jgi:hypothetical protein
MAEIADAATMELMRQQAGLAQGPNSRLIAKFSVQAEQDMEKSREAGKPVWKDQEFITIWIPGDKDNVIHRPVRYYDSLNFPTQYAAFKANKNQEVVGTPLEGVTFLSPSQKAELNYVGIKTVEALATVADVDGQKLMGFNDMKAKALKYIEAMTAAVPGQKLQAELGKRDEEIAFLKQMAEEQGKKIEELTRKKAV